MKILVTGSCGYKGAVLVPKLLALGHEVFAVDTQWFGNPLAPHPRLTVVKADVRYSDNVVGMEIVDTVIHLASIANDPCANLNPALTWDVIANGTTRLAQAAANSGVRHFIFASSASVYGISRLPNVTEEAPTVPLTTYNQAKLVAERALLSYADDDGIDSDMEISIVRPATVCGLSPAMRLDVVVNLLTMQALSRGKITVLGGAQHRPNIHIEDITDLYCWLLDRPGIGTVNAGAENLTVLEIATLVADRTGAEVEVRESNDDRSYRLDSTALKTLGWTPKRTVAQAIDEIVHAHNTGALIESDEMSRVNWMRRENIQT